jgi:hypothetical protein
VGTAHKHLEYTRFLHTSLPCGRVNSDGVDNGNLTDTVRTPYWYDTKAVATLQFTTCALAICLRSLDLALLPLTQPLSLVLRTPYHTIPHHTACTRTHALARTRTRPRTHSHALARTRTRPRTHSHALAPIRTHALTCTHCSLHFTCTAPVTKNLAASVHATTRLLNRVCRRTHNITTALSKLGIGQMSGRMKNWMN